MEWQSCDDMIHEAMDLHCHIEDSSVSRKVLGRHILMKHCPWTKVRLWNVLSFTLSQWRAG